MQVQWDYLFQGLFRWMHVVAGILWIGMLYFFNFVNSAFASTMDGETKKKVVPELMPRALFWFRWGAAFTWVTGAILVAWVYYHGKLVMAKPEDGWSVGLGLGIAFVFGAVFIYDAVFGKFVNNLKVAFWLGLVLSTGVAWALQYLCGFGFRGSLLHVGIMFGTIMAFNVWFRIWPAQRKIITAVKEGTAPDAALVGMAGTRSRHNTYMSVPLVFAMLNEHVTWAQTAENIPNFFIPAVIFAGWSVVWMLYRKAPKVKGF